MRHSDNLNYWEPCCISYLHLKGWEGQSGLLSKIVYGIKVDFFRPEAVLIASKLERLEWCQCKADSNPCLDDLFPGDSKFPAHKVSCHCYHLITDHLRSSPDILV